MASNDSVPVGIRNGNVPLNANPPLIEQRNQVFAIIARGLNFNEVKSLSRHLLDMEENELTNVEIKYGDCRAMTILNLYEQKGKSMRKLLGVLRLGLNRNDLADSIEELLRR